MMIGNLEIPKIENKYDGYGNIIESSNEYKEINNYGHEWFEEKPIDVEKLKIDNLSMQQMVEMLKVDKEVARKDMLKHQFEKGIIPNTTINQQRREERFWDLVYDIKELEQQVDMNEWLIRRSENND